MIALLLLVSILFIPMVGVPLTLISATNINSYKYSRIVILAMYFGLIGFFFVPKYGTDLSRYFENSVDILRGASYSSMLSSMQQTDLFFIVQKSLFFLVSRFKTDQMLPAVTLFVIYLVAFFILISYARKFNYSRKQVFGAFVVILAIFPLSSLANNTRNILAVALFDVGLYLELEEKKIVPAYILYFLSMSMHIAAVPLVLIKLIVSYFYNIKSRKLLRNIIFLLIIIAVAVFLIKNGIINSVLDKGTSYFNGGEAGSGLQQWFEAADRSIVEKVSKFLGGSIGILIIFYAIRDLLYSKNIRDNTFLNKELLINICIFTGISVFLTFRSGTTWFRFYMIELFYLPIFLKYSLNQKNILVKNIVLIIWIVLILSNILLQVYRLKNQADIGLLVKSVLLMPIFSLFQ
ncbi:EpsG family protein [Latilactobacillus curvatus]|uniref:EpsG family protein n=1 Tax=Latilactobacillus curvatus TaxID=28038 RepID=UPI0038891BC9